MFKNLSRGAGALLAAVVACAAAAAAAAAPPASTPAGAKAPLVVGFVYVTPVGEAGWTYQHELGRREMERALGARVRTIAVESVAEGADAERVMRDLVAQQGATLVFATSFGYLEPALRVAAEFPTRALRARRRLQERAQPRHLRRPLLRGALAGRLARRANEQERRRRLRRRLSGARGRAGHQRVRARHARRQPEARRCASSG